MPGFFRALRPTFRYWMKTEVHVYAFSVAANVLLYPRTIWPFSAIAAAIDGWGIRKGILVTPYRRDDREFPVASRVAPKALWLPSAFTITDDDVATVCESIVSFLKT